MSFKKRYDGKLKICITCSKSTEERLQSPHGICPYSSGNKDMSCWEPNTIPSVDEMSTWEYLEEVLPTLKNEIKRLNQNEYSDNTRARIATSFCKKLKVKPENLVKVEITKVKYE